MFGGKSSLTIVFVGRNQLQFFGTHGNTIVSLDVQETLVRDMAVVDRPGLEKHIEAALTRENGPIGLLVLVLSESVYFSAVIAETDEVKAQAATQQFFDSVPFAAVSKKVYPQERGVAAVAANRELIEVLTGVFTRLGYSIAGIIPSFVLGATGAKQSLDEEMALAVGKNISTITKFRLDEEKEFSAGADKALSSGMQKPRHLLVLVAIFILLLVILLVVVALQFSR